MMSDSLKGSRKVEILVLARLQQKVQQKATLPLKAIRRCIKEKSLSKSIIRCTTSIDFREQGYAVKVKIPEESTTSQFFTTHPNLVRGRRKDIVEMVFKDRKNFDHFLATLRKRYIIQEMFTIAEDIRRERFLYRSDLN